MRKIIVTTHVTLDGVMQAALSSEEDPSEGFKYGDWAVPIADAMSGKAIQKEVNKPTVICLIWQKNELGEVSKSALSC